MCPSTDHVVPGGGDFAAEVLRDLLTLITEENTAGSHPFLVSHAWTDGPVMYLVYEAPPSGITWGLVRDTRESNMEPAPWPSLKKAVRYYYLLDLVENRVSAAFQHPGDPKTILWHGDHPYIPYEGLPQRTSEIPEAYRYTPSPLPINPPPPPALGEPRRYADPI